MLPAPGTMPSNNMCNNTAFNLLVWCTVHAAPSQATLINSNTLSHWSGPAMPCLSCPASRLWPTFTLPPGSLSLSLSQSATHHPQFHTHRDRKGASNVWFQIIISWQSRDASRLCTDCASWASLACRWLSVGARVNAHSSVLRSFRSAKTCLFSSSMVCMQHDRGQSRGQTLASSLCTVPRASAHANTHCDQAGMFHGSSALQTKHGAHPLSQACAALASADQPRMGVRFQIYTLRNCRVVATCWCDGRAHT